MHNSSADAKLRLRVQPAQRTSENMFTQCTGQQLTWSFTRLLDVSAARKGDVRQGAYAWTSSLSAHLLKDDELTARRPHLEFTARR